MDDNRRYEHQFWLDLTGKEHKIKIIDTCREKSGCAMCGEGCSIHYEIAHEILPEAEWPQDKLFELGWVKVESILGGCQVKNDITQAQRNKLDELGWRVIQNHRGKWLNI